jgi:hypothetical protein
VSYSPLYANHPASANNLAIFADCPHCFNRILKTDFEAIGNFRVWIWVCCITELLEVFNCDTVFIWGVAKNDNVEGFSGLERSSSLRCLCHRGIKVQILHRLSDKSQGTKDKIPTERWRYDGLPLFVTPNISLTDAMGGASSSDVWRCLGTRDGINVVGRELKG